MSEQFPEHVLVDDPLNQVTRTERRNLLGVSALGIVIVKTGLLPTQISALGIQFSQTDRVALLHSIAIVDIYFLIAFLLYAVSDSGSGSLRAIMQFSVILRILLRIGSWQRKNMGRVYVPMKSILPS